MGLLDRGRAWLGAVAERESSVTVLYRRRQQPQSPIEDIPATMGDSTYESDEAGPVQREWRSNDFMINADRLTLGGRFEPEEGDSIEVTINGTVRTYEVMRPISTEPCFRYSNAGETRVRIHTKRVRS